MEINIDFNLEIEILKTISADIKPFSDIEFKKLAKEMVLLKNEAKFDIADHKSPDAFSEIEIIDYDNKIINLELKYGNRNKPAKCVTKKIKIIRESMEVIEEFNELDEKAMADQPKSIQELVEKIYNDQKDNPLFIGDIHNNDTAEDFAIEHHHGFGTWIRNQFGLWSHNTPVYFECRTLGLKHADDMSHKILLELYNYAKEQYRLSPPSNFILP